MKVLLLVAAAVGLGAIMAGNVLPDVTRYQESEGCRGADRQGWA